MNNSIHVQIKIVKFWYLLRERQGDREGGETGDREGGEREIEKERDGEREREIEESERGGREREIGYVGVRQGKQEHEEVG